MPESGRSTPATAIVPTVVEMIVGVVHPGAMGAVVGGEARAEVRWARENRSPATKRRADEHELVDVHTLNALVGEVDLLLSVCPPHAALDVAHQIATLGFDGIYVDANAVAPATTVEIAELFDEFVDGGIVGPPPRQRDTTSLYLSGELANQVADVWHGSALEPIVLDHRIGSASALKMAFAGWTKGSAALLLAMRTYAESQGVGDALAREWATSIPGLNERLERMLDGTPAKAWRFVGEMEEIARSLEVAGLPSGFHDGARHMFQTLEGLDEVPDRTLEVMLGWLLDHTGEKEQR